MNLINRLRDFFHKGSSLRNKPGGMAYIRGIEEIEGRVVTTMKVTHGNFWVIDPPQKYVVQRAMIVGRGGVVAFRGDIVESLAIADSCLIPIPEIGDDERTQEQEFQPKVPEGGRVVA